MIDVSGSMSDSIGGGQSKIQFAADAEKAAIDFFPDTSSLGLWTFSAKSNPSQDWTQVVTLGPLASKVGTVTRRQALVAAAATLPGRTGGDTGLYNTVLGAYQAVRTGYDPAAANSVVLLTDGSNTQTAGIGPGDPAVDAAQPDDVRGPAADHHDRRRQGRGRGHPAADLGGDRRQHADRGGAGRHSRCRPRCTGAGRMSTD